MTASVPKKIQTHKRLIIIIMYIYHVLINALSVHMIHINVSTLFYTHIEHSPTKTTYIRYYMQTHTHIHTHRHTHTHALTDFSRNWALTLVGAEIL